MHVCVYIQEFSIAQRHRHIYNSLTGVYPIKGIIIIILSLIFWDVCYLTAKLTEDKMESFAWQSAMRTVPLVTVHANFVSDLLPENIGY